MNKLIMLLLFSITTNAYALPDCPSDISKLWDKCFGTYTFAEGDKYVGEWKDNKRHGQGTYTFPDGKQNIGYFLNDVYIPYTCEAMGLVKGSSEFGQCVIALINKL